jgi:quinol monooxygenase YgiN
MFGLIGKMRVVAGRRDELIAILRTGAGAMPGCISYVIAEDPGDADTIWITEVWDLEENHKASLQLPEVRAAIAKGRPLIAGFDRVARTRPVAGVKH